MASRLKATQTMFPSRAPTSATTGIFPHYGHHPWFRLQNDFGIDPSRLTAGGRGEYNPIATNSTSSGRAENRRTEIIITPKLDQFLDLIDKAPDTL